MSDQEENAGEIENEEIEQPAAPKTQERPQNVIIQTPLDRPEFNWFIEEYMRRLGLSDRKEAALSLTNMFYDMGLDPYADLKEVQAALQQMNVILQSLPNTPQAMRVKDTLGAVYSAEAGKAMLNRLPKTHGDDPFEDRLEKVMDRYMPMILMMNMMKGMASGEMPQQRERQNEPPPTFEIPPEYKAKMDNIEAQLAQTQALLQQQTEEKRQKEHDELIITSVNQSFAPQLEALHAEVSSLTQNLQAMAQVKVTEAPSSDSMKEITRKLDDLQSQLSLKKESAKLSLDDVSTVLGTLETIEARIKKEVPAGEFDWKTGALNSISEIGKEVIGAVRDLNIARVNAPQASPSMAPQGMQQQSANLQPATDKQVAIQKLQNYIMQNLQKGIQEIRMEEATKALGLTPQQVLEAYNELQKAGYIKQSGAAPQPQKPPAAAPNQPTPPPSAPPPTSNAAPVASTPSGAAIENRFDEHSPFLER
jgi:phage host-nuclease inhibitor protein Gam